MTSNGEGGPDGPAERGVRFLEHPQHPLNVELLGVYEALRGDRDMPSRADLDLRKLKRVMSGLLLVEPVNGTEMRFRVVGSAIDRRLGIALTGHRSGELFSPEDAERVRRFFEPVFTKGARAIVRGHFRILDIEHFDRELMLLPLRGKDDNKIWSLGGMFAFDARTEGR